LVSSASAFAVFASRIASAIGREFLKFYFLVKKKKFTRVIIRKILKILKIKKIRETYRVFRDD
jgi:hypothetical protein